MVSKNTIIVFFLVLSCSGMVEGLKFKREAGLDQALAGFNKAEATLTAAEGATSTAEATSSTAEATSSTAEATSITAEATSSTAEAKSSTAEATSSTAEAKSSTAEALSSTAEATSSTEATPTRTTLVAMETTGFVPTTTTTVTQKYCVTVVPWPFEPFGLFADDKPHPFDDGSEKCNIEYLFHKNGTFSKYSHYGSSIDELPKNVTYIGEDKTQWCSYDPSYKDFKTKEVLQQIYCVCEGSMCNGLGSPLHYELLKMVKNITGLDFPEPLPGFVPTKPVTPKYCYAVFPLSREHFPISTKYLQMTVDEKAECSIQYNFYGHGTVVKYVHGITQANPPADPRNTTYVGENKNQWCSHELFYNEYNIYEHKILCQCQDDLCNGFGSPIHYQLLKMVKDITGSDFPKPFPGFVPTTTTTVSTTAETTSTTTKATPTTSKKVHFEKSKGEIKKEQANKTTDETAPVKDQGTQTGDSKVPGNGGNGVAGIKPFLTILSFVMMIYNIILV